jgi:hypothetical protein
MKVYTLLNHRRLVMSAKTRATIEDLYKVKGKAEPRERGDCPHVADRKEAGPGGGADLRELASA